MRVEYDSFRDLMYIWLAPVGKKAARTETIAPGVHVDFDRDDKLVGIEILDASEVLQHRLQFEVALSPAPAEMVAQPA